MAKILIAFFSRADENYFGGKMKYVEIGNTEIVVNHMKDLIEADIFKIRMKKPYSASYKACVGEAMKDFRENARPELASVLESIEDYDTVVLAYPNYCGTMPMPVVTFLEQYDFSGKRILPLCTNEGSGMGSSVSDLKKYASGAAVSDGLSITGSRAADSKEKVKKWLQENGLL